MAIPLDKKYHVAAVVRLKPDGARAIVLDNDLEKSQTKYLGMVHLAKDNLWDKREFEHEAIEGPWVEPYRIVFEGTVACANAQMPTLNYFIVHPDLGNQIVKELQDVHDKRVVITIKEKL